MATAARNNSPEYTHNGVSKVVRYGWTMKDAPGSFAMLPKKALKVAPEYQRVNEVVESKVLEIASEWSWMSCAALVVAYRDGSYWVVDGQHRWCGAMRRPDIQELPCLIFETEDVTEEAVAFLGCNDKRKHVSAIAKHRARVVAGDPIAILVQQTFAELGLRVIKTATQANDIACVSWAQKHAAIDAERFRKVLRVGAPLCAADNMPVAEKILDGLIYLEANVPGGVTSPRMAKRLRDVGAQRLLDGALRAASYFARGGGKVFATGMLDALNKGLHTKFAFAAETPHA